MSPQTDNLAELRQHEQAAMEAYSATHTAVEAAVADQAKSTRQRAAIAEQQELTKRLCVESEHRAMGHAAAGAFNEFRKETAQLQVLRAEAHLLARAVCWHDLFPGADSERAALAARHAEQVARHAAEAARKAAHEAQVLDTIAQASSVAGGLTVEGLGPISDELAALVERARRDVLDAAARVEEHDNDTRTARIQFNQERS